MVVVVVVAAAAVVAVLLLLSLLLLLYTHMCTRPHARAHTYHHIENTDFERKMANKYMHSQLTSSLTYQNTTFTDKEKKETSFNIVDEPNQGRLLHYQNAVD